MWQTLKEKSVETKRPFTILAPMEDVTDNVFRQIVLSQGRPDLFMTEFTNCDGLMSRGREHVIHRFDFTPGQHPIVAQIWGKRPETYSQVVSLIVEMGFDGVDINMGCPVPNVIKNGAGAGLIKEPTLASEIIQAVREAIAASARPELGFSVKTRLGNQEIQFEWIEHLMKQPIDALTFHLRTIKELSKVPAHWEVMPEIIALRDKINPELVMIGNGDVTTKEQLATYGNIYGVDGLMIGRGIFENLWLFSQEKDGTTATVQERLGLLKQHIMLFDRTWGKRKNFELMKKFFKVYLSGFDGAPALRNDLMLLKNVDEMASVIDNFQF